MALVMRRKQRSSIRPQNLVRWLFKKIGWTSRRVNFHPQARVHEFERQLLGGGGVPDGDAVALGLGPRCVNTYVSPLVDKEDKDEYASSGYLDVSQRTRLLSQWMPRPSMKKQLEKARPEIEKLQRSRDETAHSPRDQRYMPSNMGQALENATVDEEEAEAVRVALGKREASQAAGGASDTPSGLSSTRSAARAAATAADFAASATPTSPIRKRRRS